MITITREGSGYFILLFQELDTIVLFMIHFIGIMILSTGVQDFIWIPGHATGCTGEWGYILRIIVGILHMIGMGMVGMDMVGMDIVGMDTVGMDMVGMGRIMEVTVIPSVLFAPMMFIMGIAGQEPATGLLPVALLPLSEALQGGAT